VAARVSILDALAARLTSASVATSASNLFLGIMPDSPNVCAALYEYAGEYPMEAFSPTTAQIDRTRVQVMTRSGRDDYSAARTLMVNVRDNLTGVVNQVVDGVTFLRVSELGPIEFVGRDEDDRPQFALSLRVLSQR